ncbi:MAG: hypothetical protein ACFE98_06630, partial [Candidatus Hermodarchaeota archaeon]
MPKCSRCGSYYIRPPCPVCSPPSVKQLVEDSPEVKGKTIEELQSDLKHLRETLKKEESDLESRTLELKTSIDSINDQISELELSKVSSQEKKLSIENSITSLSNDINSLEETTKMIQREKNALENSIKKAEDDIRNLDSEIYSLKERINERQAMEEEQRQLEKKRQQE